MDISVIKSRLSALQNPRGGQKKDLSQTIWRPSVGKHSVRIVPSVFNKQNPFKEVYMHYGINNRTMMSLSNFNEKDPIVEFAQGLRKSSEKDNWQLAKKLEPKMRVFAPVIVRGEESEGVQLWEFGKEIYEAFLQMAADEEVGDFSDIMSGRDIKLVTVGPESTGTAYNKTSIAPSMKTSALSEDSKLIEKWLEEQENPLDLYKPLPFDTIKQALQEWLNPEDEEEGMEEVIDEVKAEPKSNYSLSTKPASKKSKEEQNELLEIAEEYLDKY